MSKKTLALIIFLTIITGFLLYTAFRSAQPQQKNAPTSLTPTVPVAATLSLQETTPTHATHALAVVVDPHGLLVTGVQFAISYDPQVVTTVSVTPGQLFQKNVVLLNDVQDGKIFYAIGLPPHSTPITTSGVAATISYAVLPTKQTQTKFAFLPKTLVTAQGINQSVLKSTTDLTVSLGSSQSAMPITLPASGSSLMHPLATPSAQ